ncbi:hypothetical protein PUN28_018833 [Cardiocondyla obscurior]|uniref:Uncharacterized protein n=1 Tax=Cardiocondyla obscurior TaxID=286306 RepID=A0AAW2EGK2_9HYME
MFAATPARLRYRFPMLAQLPPHHGLLRASRLDGVKCAPSPTRVADFSSYVYQPALGNAHYQREGMILSSIHARNESGEMDGWISNTKRAGY